MTTKWPRRADGSISIEYETQPDGLMVRPCGAFNGEWRWKAYDLGLSTSTR